MARHAQHVDAALKDIGDLALAVSRVRAKCADDGPHPHHEHLCPDDVLKLLDGGER